jgi:RNA polymerase sigma-70 factor (ECF subfamily)
MARVQANDPASLGELYDRFFSRAYGVSMSVCHEHGRAEDAVQESFVSIWRSRANYRPDRGTVASWLLTVVRHRAIDVERRNDRHAARDVRDVGLQALPSRDDVAAEAVEMDSAGRLRGVLARLPDTQREVITLAFYG